MVFRSSQLCFALACFLSCGRIGESRLLRLRGVARPVRWPWPGRSRPELKLLVLLALAALAALAAPARRRHSKGC